MSVGEITHQQKSVVMMTICESARQPDHSRPASVLVNAWNQRAQKGAPLPDEKSQDIDQEAKKEAMKKALYTGEEFIVKGDVLRAFYNIDCFYFPETMKDDDAVYSLYHGKWQFLDSEIVLLREKQRKLEQAYEKWIKREERE